MSLIQRKPRPIRRDETTYRDDRLFIVACDDTYAPKQYFDFFRIPRVQVHVVATVDGSSAARHVLNRLLEVDHEEDDERWLVLDTDHYTRSDHIGGFMDSLNEARRQGIQVALSKPCFEYWLLLHHLDTSRPEMTGLADASETEALLRSTLGQYNKRRLRPDDFPITSVPDAYTRAKRHDITIGGGDNPDGNTSRIYLLWKSIIARAQHSQLPESLTRLQL